MKQEKGKSDNKNAVCYTWTLQKKQNKKKQQKTHKILGENSANVSLLIT